jgi:hypothetical protein
MNNNKKNRSTMPEEKQHCLSILSTKNYITRSLSLRGEQRICSQKIKGKNIVEVFQVVD